MERLSNVKEQRDELELFVDRCYKAKLVLGACGLATGVSAAVALSLYMSQYSQSEVLPYVIGGSVAVAALSLGAYVFVNAKSNDAQDEIYYLEENYGDQIEKEEFMERISSYR